YRITPSLLATSVSSVSSSRRLGVSAMPTAIRLRREPHRTRWCPLSRRSEPGSPYHETEACDASDRRYYPDGWSRRRGNHASSDTNSVGLAAPEQRADHSSPDHMETTFSA